jgi:hypothetical protein
VSWWKKRLAVTHAETESVKARDDSKQKLVEVESLRQQVDKLSTSISDENAVNHFALRLAIAYGLPVEDK